MPDPIQAQPTSLSQLPSQEEFDQSHAAAVSQATGAPPPPPPGARPLPAQAEAPAPPAPPPGSRSLSSLDNDFFGHFWRSLPHPIDALSHGFDASIGQIQKAKDAYTNGDYGMAAAHMAGALPIVSSIAQGAPQAFHAAAESVGRGRQAVSEGRYGDAATEFVRALPGIGPQGGNVIDETRQGRYGAAAGDALGTAASLALPKAVELLSDRLPASIPVTPRVEPTLTPEVSSSIRYADTNGIPIDAATRTGNRFVRNMQTMAQNQPIASSIASRAQAATRAALGNAGDRLASEVHPSAATPESAGAGIAQELGDLSKQQQAGAMGAYGRLEQIEADPQHSKSVQIGTKLEAAPDAAGRTMDDNGAELTRTVPVMKNIALPVDMGPAITQLKPVLVRLKQEMPLAQQQASRGLQAIDNIVNGDRFQPASVADQNLSALKQLQREAINPKTMRLANMAVSTVAPLVDQAVAAAGPDAAAALNEGRSLTKAKYATDDTIAQLPLEPVRLFDKLTAQRDISINLVRDVAQKAPGSIPAVGRAYLEGLFEKATTAEGKPAAGTALTQWNKLGDATKAVLFPDPALRGRLDDFFTLAKATSENPNPSGTAHVASSLITLSEGGLMLHNPILGSAALLAWPAVTKMLYSNGGQSLLMSGLRLNIASPAAKVMAGSIARAAGIQGLAQQPAASQ